MYFLFPACPFGVAGAAVQVGISNHPNLMQLAAIFVVEFQDETRPASNIIPPASSGSPSKPFATRNSIH